jgi:hypothetical protein
MRIPGLRRKRADEAYQGAPTQIICPVCGLRNDSMARFCRNCGLPLGAPRDPVRGTVSRRADLPSEHGTGIAAIVGLAAAVVVLAGAGYLILRGSGSGSTGSTTPGAGGVANASIDPSGSPDPGVLPSRAPSSALASGGPEPSGGSPDPSGATPAPSGELVADTGWTCDPASFVDPTEGSWRVSEALWGPRQRWDEVTFVLTRTPERGRTTISIESMSPGEAARVSGLDEPPGDRALLMTFDGDATIRQEIVAQMDLRAVEFLNVATSGDTMYAVVSANTDGCYRLYVPGWKRGTETTQGDTVRLLLDVRYR